MKKGLFFSFILIILLSSCSGILWDARSAGDFTISISNPFYQPGRAASDSSRALALQGQYIYIELALISDQAAYDADTDKAISGNGNWVETSWGGHAIIAQGIDLTSAFEIENFTFVDVPRDQEIQARVLVDSDKTVFEEMISQYDFIEMFPICQTYNPAAVNEIKYQWIPLSVEEMSDNLVVLPIRPYYPETLFWGTSAYITDDYTSAAQTIPSIGYTRFFSIDADLASLELLDFAYFSSVSGSVLTSGAAPTSLLLLHDELGSLIEPNSPVYTYNVGSGFYDYSQYQYDIVSLNNYTSQGYIVSTTLSSLPSLMWNVLFGVLYVTPIHNFDSIVWTLPPGIIAENIEYNVVQTVRQDLSLSDIDSLSEISVLEKGFDLNWDNSQISISGSTCTLAGSFDIWFGEWFIVIGRNADGEEFILGRVQAAG